MTTPPSTSTESSSTPLLMHEARHDSFVQPHAAQGLPFWAKGSVLREDMVAVIVTLTEKTRFDLSVPSTMLTVVGVVCGFVLSVRTSSGLDRYLQARGAWADVTRLTRTLGRVIWIHTTRDCTSKELEERRVVLKLVEAFAVGLKHHLRGEHGVYYEDLYYLLLATLPKPPTPPPSPSMVYSPTSSYAQPSSIQQHLYAPSPTPSPAPARPSTPPRVRPITHYSSLPLPLTSSSTALHPPSSRSRALNPPTVAAIQRLAAREPVSSFSACFEGIHRFFAEKVDEGVERRKAMVGGKYRPKVPGDDCGNVPLEIVRGLDEWVATLEQDGKVSGNVLGQISQCLKDMEDALTVCEKILTTPLPYVFAAHLRTVWLYLILLPFQLEKTIQWLTIPGLTIAAFFFLGFMSAGAELQQPFGYDANDIDLDSICDQIIARDMKALLDHRKVGHSSPPWRNGGLRA